MSLRPCTIITGASTGIGREIALLAAAEGHVVLVARDRVALESFCINLRNKAQSASYIALDLGLESSGEAIEKHLLENGLYCETLVANAGLGHVGLASVIGLEAQLAIVNVNIRSVTDLCLRFLPGMIERGHGRIMTLSSIASGSPGPGMAVYYASKAYVRTLSEALWQETQGTGVTVTCLCPGPVNTPFLTKSGARNTNLFRIIRLKGAEYVALDGWNGLKKGQILVVPGFAAKVAFYLAKLIPTRMILPWLLNAHTTRAYRKDD